MPSRRDELITKHLFHAGKRRFAAWELISAHGIYGFVFFFIGFWFANGREVGFIGELVVAVLATLVLTFGLRYVVRRPRPSLATSYKPLSAKYGFPSAHASSAFVLATMISLQVLSTGVHAFSIAAAILLFVLAIVVSISRVMIGVHYVTDVLVGAALGTGVAFLMTTL